MGDLARHVRQFPRHVVRFDDHDLALRGDRQVADRQGVLDRFCVRNEDVQLGHLRRARAGGSCDVDACVGDCSRDALESAWLVGDLDSQVVCHVAAASLDS